MNANTGFPRVGAALLAGLALGALGAPLAAQTPVVQALPSPARAQLASALQRLARAPGDFDALIDAGKASLELGDLSAATGFFSRADVIRRGDPRVKAGLAVASLKSGDPVGALQLFEQAEAAGAPAATLAADRGLAFDLVGDNAAAQSQYRLALGQGANDEISRRLGISQAIAGNSRAFEATLLPLLQRKDMAAYRARAFGLAIMGNEKEAMSIVSAVMPAAMAERVGSYMAYMPRLTRAQQAAAANLGAFPRAAQIGRDDPRVAQYAARVPTRVAVATADARLAPSGAPLGPSATSRASTAPVSASERRRLAALEKERAKAAARQLAQARSATAAPPASATPAPAPVSARPITGTSAAPTFASVRGELPPVAATPRPVIVAQATAPTAAPVAVLPSASPTPTPPAPAAAATVAAAPARPVITLAPPSPAPAIGTPPPAASAPPALAAVAAPTVATPAPVVVQRVAVDTSAPAAPAPVSLADAFAEFGNAAPVAKPAAGAVDVTAIKARREAKKVATPPPAAPPPPPPPPKPKVPSRVWVQVATGKDTRALAFDWRKFAKQAPAALAKRDAYTVKWGISRRLVTGPFASAREAAKALADLKKAGLDGFVFTSDEGEEVTPLK